MKKKRFYIVHECDVFGNKGFSWIEYGDPYSEGHGWFSSKYEAVNAAKKALRLK